MSDSNQEETTSPSAVSNRAMEVIVAAVTFLLGALVVYDSLRLGTGWGDEGQKAGYFPFYIGCVLLAGAATVVFQTLRAWNADGGKGVFTGYKEAGLMLKMLVPMVLYVAGIFILGLYAASTIFIAAFMLCQGKYGVLKSLLVGVGVSAALFLLFEVWFLVPLPKGPIEQLLGY